MHSVNQIDYKYNCSKGGVENRKTARMRINIMPVFDCIGIQFAWYPYNPPRFLLSLLCLATKQTDKQTNKMKQNKTKQKRNKSTWEDFGYHKQLDTGQTFCLSNQVLPFLWVLVALRCFCWDFSHHSRDPASTPDVMSSTGNPLYAKHALRHWNIVNEESDSAGR